MSMIIMEHRKAVQQIFVALFLSVLPTSMDFRFLMTIQIRMSCRNKDNIVKSVINATLAFTQIN